MPPTQAEREDRPTAMATDGEGGSGGPDTAPAGIEADAETAELEEQLGAPKGAGGQWAGCLRVVDPKTMTTKLVRVLVDRPIHVMHPSR